MAFAITFLSSISGQSGSSVHRRRADKLALSFFVEKGGTILAIASPQVVKVLEDDSIKLMREKTF
jgi:hypothetical protein